MPANENLRDAAERFGRAVAVRRAQIGLKRKDLAARAQLSYPFVSEIENGIKSPSARAQRQLADALELSTAELLALADSLPSDSELAAVRSDPAARAIGRLNRPQSRSHDREETVPSRPVFAMATGLHAGGEGMLDRWIRELVTMAVRAELAAWANSELPGLIRREVDRAMAERGLEG